MARTPLGWWRRQWWLDLFLGLGAATLLYRAVDGGALQGGDAVALYGAVVGASAALGTLALTPVAIVLALTPGPRLHALMAHHLATVRRAMTWTVMASLAALALGVVGLAVDSATAQHGGLRLAAVSAQFASILAMARLVWFFLALLTVEELDRESAEVEG